MSRILIPWCVSDGATLLNKNRIKKRLYNINNLKRLCWQCKMQHKVKENVCAHLVNHQPTPTAFPQSRSKENLYLSAGVSIRNFPTHQLICFTIYPSVLLPKTKLLQSSTLSRFDPLMYIINSWGFSLVIRCHFSNPIKNSYLISPKPFSYSLYIR